MKMSRSYAMVVPPIGFGLYRKFYLSEIMWKLPFGWFFSSFFLALFHRPMSASVMQVFHQEMASYYLRPSFEYQDMPSRSYKTMIDEYFPFKLLTSRVYLYQWKLTFGRRDENPSRTKSRDENFTSNKLRGNFKSFNTRTCCSFQTSTILLAFFP